MKIVILSTSERRTKLLKPAIIYSKIINTDDVKRILVHRLVKKNVGKEDPLCQTLLEKNCK